MNDYFSKIVSSLQIPESNNIYSQFERMLCVRLISIMKYRRHPNITVIQDAYKGSWKGRCYYENQKPQQKKVIQDEDIPVKTWIGNVNFFAAYICSFYNYAITTSKLSSFLKMANVTPIVKKGSKNKKENFRPVSSYQFFQKFSKN